MPTYIWKGIDRKGKKEKGEIEADNAAVARQLLLRRGITVKSFKEKPKDISDYIPALQPKVKEREIVIFVRQFATMIDAGLPLVQCLEILQDQQDNPTFRRILRSIKKDVEEGSTLSDALKKHPKVFDVLFVNLVTAGEMGGILDVILNRLAAYIEKISKLKKKVKGAMTYPGIVVTVAVVVVAVILIYVIPVFAGLFRDAGSALPPLTLFVIGISEFAQSYFHWILLGIVLLVVGIGQIRRTKKGRDVTDRMLLRLPVFGMLLRKVAVARFSRTLGTMLSSGVPILDGLDIVAAASGNTVIEKALREVRSSIAEGRPVADPLQETKVFPPMVTHMIAVGESTGALDKMLHKIADFYDEEVDVAVDALTSLLEPLLIVFLGVTVGGLLIAMYLPIFQLADVVSRGA
ncbi:type II secretion system F family protein [Desulforhabdus amnigena]|uniref:Type II secretion system protein F n=1 Tax=Desulforhabdus amnigena TaxID=40218 RepID=A0A9W6D5G6_9BACT|nr:type II secretion system F family protein [Desulforhabdus amnigena]NLJ28380.1 type II secretion system F family protein [Deltaproteobacteria bacterium]GLI34572.1 type II secretion system protein F [Desulforhabdus amnigena]